MTNLQATIVMTFGALIAAAGLWLLFTKNEAGANRLKILGQEVEISTPALVVFLVGSAIFVLPFFLPRLHDPGVWMSDPPIKGPIFGSSTEEKEPNDSFASATPIRLGTAFKGKIAVEDDRDIFVFGTSSNPQAVLTIYLQNNSMTLRPELVFYNGRKAQVERKYETTPGADLELPSLPARADSTFYVEVRSLSVYRSLGEYQLRVTAK
jgi:hypothetical protein